MSRTTRLSRRFALLACLVVALGASVFLASGPAGAQATPTPCSTNITGYEGTAVLSLSATDVAPGETVNIIGTGFPPGSSIPLSVGGVAIGTAVADANGAFSFPYTVPADAVDGNLAVSSACGAFVLTSNLRVQVSSNVVTAVPTTISTGSLVVTGSSLTVPLTTAAVVLIVGGGLLVLAFRKRGSSLADA